ncbi:hypothetical protein SAMN02745216_00335 [Desulfatibacillum alkenivorans DSM 16219]|uniref:Uncharacterized protein n=1 Tax=Desulfatibacillum alkenivorans DSM 16219 TaxID=1121393 RepID=A0A1M6CVV6_9BACT|nr:hypothetical protein [Desulfatibacillum alkenivorans]SHI64868.1 hypothetical protein SAMN02745216_00335 [Desulfatibacillum alkenivorans DSM 16219]
MELACHECGFKGEVHDFAFLCKNGCPACGESDMRQCPRCGAHVMFSRAAALEKEEVQMRDLCRELAGIERSDEPEVQKRAMELIGGLRRMNERWNIPQLGDFIKQRSRELFF